MVVPNYIPDPIEIPNNVTEQPYLVRLAYIRRVLSLHLLSVIATAASLAFKATSTRGARPDTDPAPPNFKALPIKLTSSCRSQRLLARPCNPNNSL